MISLHRYTAPLLLALFLLAPARTRAADQPLCEPCFSVPHFVLDHTPNGQVEDADGFRAILVVGEAVAPLTAGNRTHESAAFGFFSYYLTEPQPPLVRASDGDYEDHIEISWEIADDRTGPPVSGQTVQLLRNGAILQTLPIDQTQYLDFNVFAGEEYEYAVVAANDLGRSHPRADAGFLDPNGTIIGKVETPNGNPVADVKVVLTPNLGRAAHFAGESYVFFPNSFDGLARSYTIEGWFRSIQAQEQTLFAAVDSATTRPFVRLRLTADGHLQWEHRGAGSGASDILTTPIGYTADGEWHHFAAALADSDMSMGLYVDGRLVARGTAADTIGTQRAQIVLGKKGPLEHEQYFQGYLDEWRIWSQARSRAQIRRDRDRTLAGDEDGLETYWKFDEVKGDIAFDLTDNGHDGQLCRVERSSFRAPVFVSGLTDASGHYAIRGIFYGAGTTFAATPQKETPIGTSLFFDGADYLAFAQQRLDLTDGYTVELWFKTPGGGAMTLFAAADPGDGSAQMRLELLADGRLQLVHGSAVLTSAERYDTEFWYHAAATFAPASGQLQLYVDGQPVASGTAAALATPSAFAIGRQGPQQSAQYYRGWLDEIRVWNQGRTSEQINAVKSQVLAGNEDGLIAYWKLNEGDGSLVIDASGGGHTGDLAGAPQWSDDIPLDEVFVNTFDPETRQVALSPTNTTVDRVDFTDISQIAVSGFVRYSGTTCLIEGAEILVDGQSQVPPVFTDESGRFVVEFEPGSRNKRLSVSFGGHEISPAFIELPTITRPISGLFFEDLVKRRFSGQVAGGLCRFPITPAQGQIEVEVVSVDGCISAVAVPDPQTGHFAIADLPPLTYAVTVHHPDPEIDAFFAADTLSLEAGDGQRDFVFRAPPQVRISGFPVNGCGLRVMEMAEVYQLDIEVFETYLASGQAQSCAADSGAIVVFDDIGDAGQSEISFAEGRAQYEVVARFPNIVGGGEHPFQKRIQVTATDALGRSASAEEWTYVTGNRPRQINFATTSPQIPFLVLRQPPGDQSFSFVEQGQTLQSSVRMGYNTGQETNTFATVHLGPDLSFSTGFIFSTQTSIDVTLDFTAEMGFKQSQSTTQEQTWSFTATETFATAGEGDVYVGGALNILYGVTDVLSIDENTCQTSVDPDIIVVPGGFASTFIYSESFILDSVIPELEGLGDIASADLWRSFVARNDSLKEAATFVENISFDAGSEFTRSTTSEITQSVTHEFEMEIDAGVALEAGVTVNGLGFTGGVKTTWSFTQGVAQSQSTTRTNTVSYTLADDDAGDNFSVNIKSDPVYGTPVFEVVSGVSSCPWEPGTVPVDGPQLTVSPAQQVDVPPDEAAVFDLTLGNTSQTEADRTYLLRVVNESNPAGAAIAFNGVFVEDGLSFDIPFGEAVQAVMSVFRGPQEYVYDDLFVELVSSCDAGISAQASVSAHFTVPCSEVRIAVPESGWQVTAADPATVLPVILDRYDRADPNLERLEVQYRPASGGDWFTAATIARADLPTAEDFVLVEWNIDPAIVGDGAYQLRARAFCGLDRVPGTSAIVAGTIDRAGPQVLGEPWPTDGVLGPGDLIGLRFDEDIDCAAINVAAGHVALSNAATGEPIDLDYTCGGNEISVAPAVQNAFIENAVLRARVGPVRDAFGNSSGLVEWEFLVNRNPLAWSGGELSGIAIFDDEVFSGTRSLVNNGGGVLSFSIDDIPSWLTVTPSSGTVPPGGSQEISFAVDGSQVGVGSYAQTLFASGTEGDEPTQVEVRVLCHPPEWGQVDPTDFRHSMTLVATLATDGELSDDVYDRVGVFIGEELRGLAQVEYVPAFGQLAGAATHLVFLTVYGNDEDIGQSLDLRVWDASACRELGLVMEEFRFEVNAHLGSPASPTTITATSQIIGQIPLSDGWNWFSLNLVPDDASLDAVLASLTPAGGDLLRDQSRFSQYVEGIGWLGSLDSLRSESMYLLHLSRADTLEVIGYAVDVEQTPIELVRGWNWIGYLPQSSIEVNAALASLQAQSGDLIKGQTAFSQYVEGIGWIGSLKFLHPHQAYQLFVQQPATLIYPLAAPAARMGTAPPEEVVAARGWRVEPRRYEHSMAVIAAIEGEGILDSGDLVAAFVGDEVRGIGQTIYAPGQERYVAFITIYGHTPRDGQVEFRFLDGGRERFVATRTPFVADAVLGRVEQPFLLESRRRRPGDRGFVPEVFSLEPAHPNPFNPSTRLGYGLPADGPVELAIYNALGQRVRRLEKGFARAGYYYAEWDGRDEAGGPLPSGLYFAVLRAGEFRATRKLMLLK